MSGLLLWDNWHPKHHGAEAGIVQQSAYKSVRVVLDRQSRKGYFAVEVNVADQLIEEWLYSAN